MSMVEKFVELLKLQDAADDKKEGLIQTRLKGIGFRNPCFRCGGAGNYGNYGVCFRCGGIGNDPFKLTKALYEEAEAAVEAGKLDDYFADLTRKQKLKKADKDLFSLAYNNQLSEDYSAEYHRARSDMNAIIKDLHFKQTDRYKVYEALAKKTHNEYFAKDRSGKYRNGTDEERAEAERTLEAVYDATKKVMEEFNASYEAMKAIFKGE